jgi:hypothetical protein
MKFLRSFVLTILVAVPLFSQSAETRKGYRPLVAALHVHSRFSNGEIDVGQLAREAKSRNIDVLGVTDSFLTRVRYGVPPMRRLLSRSASRQSVMDAGTDAYLARFDEAQRQVGDVVLLPGVEAAPFYYWRGAFPNSLELHDFDRHVLVFGLRDANVLRNLPVIENARWSNTTRHLQTIVVPMIVLLAGVLLFAITRHKLRWAGGILTLLGAGMIADAYPFAQTPDPYSGKPDDAAFQRTIDYVERHGGIAYWSYPEARFPDITMSSARMVSRGRPETLVNTDRYTGFEGLYGDNITITRPGDLWDQLLLDYTRRGRKTWPSVITGIDFHYFKPGYAWYQLDSGVTILYTKEKKEADVLEALRLGRGYATFQKNAKNRLDLSDFALRGDDQTAIAGETLKTRGPAALSAKVDWIGEAPEGNTMARIRVVRDGVLIDEFERAIPATIERQDELPPGLHYYRIHIEVAGTQILSNPIFCEISN